MDFGHVPDEKPADDRIAALVQHIDDLLGEAARLRNEIVGAVRARVDRPFWPDRRRSNVPHEPDRRVR